MYTHPIELDALGRLLVTCDRSSRQLRPSFICESTISGYSEEYNAQVKFIGRSSTFNSPTVEMNPFLAGVSPFRKVLAHWRRPAWRFAGHVS